MSGPFSSPLSVLIIPVCEGPRCPPLMRRLVTRGAQRVLEVGEGHAWLQAPEGDEPPGAQPWVQAWRRPRSHPQPAVAVWLWRRGQAAGCRPCRQDQGLAKHVAKLCCRERKDCYPCQQSFSQVQVYTFGANGQ